MEDRSPQVRGQQSSASIPQAPRHSPAWADLPSFLLSRQEAGTSKGEGTCPQWSDLAAAPLSRSVRPVWSRDGSPLRCVLLPGLSASLPPSPGGGLGDLTRKCLFSAFR